MLSYYGGLWKEHILRTAGACWTWQKVSLCVVFCWDFQHSSLLYCKLPTKESNGDGGNGECVMSAFDWSSCQAWIASISPPGFLFCSLMSTTFTRTLLMADFNALREWNGDLHCYKVFTGGTPFHKNICVVSISSKFPFLGLQRKAKIMMMNDETL